VDSLVILTQAGEFSLRLWTAGVCFQKVKISIILNCWQMSLTLFRVPRILITKAYTSKYS